MLDGVDYLLRRLFLDEVALLTPSGGTPDDQQVGFQPPDKDWRKHVGDLGERRCLNVYLADLREHLEYRSNEVVRDAYHRPTGQRPPSWLDSHYLITAWSPATSAAGGRLVEHAMLFQVAQALLARPALRVSEIFRSQPFPVGYPPGLRDAELPAMVVPGDGFPKLAEFWGAMGTDQIWRPAVYLVVTVPVPYPVPAPGAAVTTRVLRLNGEQVVEIAGRVLAPAGAGGAGPVAVPGAWIRLETTSGTQLGTTRSDDQGRFTFDGLTPDRYRLRWRALGHAEPPPRDIDVPSPAGGYDLSFP
jgi:Pvc16 N-terminal domain/Carboxypeptidase regulatory-like domain